MAKKLSLMLAAAALLAFAIPSMANAATGLTTGGSPGGVLVPVGTKIRGTNVGVITTTTNKVGNIECSTVTVEGEVTENSETKGIKGVGVGEGTASECNVGGNAATITNIKLNSLASSAAETEEGKAELSFTADLPGSTVCNFSTAAGGTVGTFVTNSDKITFTKAPLVAAPTGCGKATLDGTFTLETLAGAAVFIM